MSDDKPQTPGGVGQPHTVKAGLFDAWFGNRGPNGELLHNGEPVLAQDVPPEYGEDEDD